MDEFSNFIAFDSIQSAICWTVRPPKDINPRLKGRFRVRICPTHRKKVFLSSGSNFGSETSTFSHFFWKLSRTLGHRNTGASKLNFKCRHLEAKLRKKKIATFLLMLFRISFWSFERSCQTFFSASFGQQQSTSKPELVSVLRLNWIHLSLSRYPSWSLSLSLSLARAQTHGHFLTRTHAGSLSPARQHWNARKRRVDEKNV